MAGQMYPWVGDTWNPVRGKCPHECEYCYVETFKDNPNIRAKYSGEPLFDDGARPPKIKSKMIFVCSMTDLFAEGVVDEVIYRVLRKARHHSMKVYKRMQRYPCFLLQTKNPMRMVKFLELMPPSVMLGTTIETSEDDISKAYSKAPPVSERVRGMKELKIRASNFPRMVSVEPIMRCQPEKLARMVNECEPEFVSVGADSKGNFLPEPSEEDIKVFLETLDDEIEIKLKKNLERIYNE